VNNSEVAEVFTDIAHLLELKQENPFKIRAYRRAASTIKDLTEAVDKLVAEDRLREVAGVGEAIAKKISELVNSGQLGFYERLKAELAEKKGG